MKISNMRILKNFQRQISLMITGNQKFQCISKVASLLPITVVVVSKNTPFRGRVEYKKCYEYLRLPNIFTNVLQIIIEVLGLYKQCAR